MILIKGSENKAGDGSIKMKPSNTPTHVRVISNLSYQSSHGSHHHKQSGNNWSLNSSAQMGPIQAGHSRISSLVAPQRRDSLHYLEEEFNNQQAKKSNVIENEEKEIQFSAKQQVEIMNLTNEFPLNLRDIIIELYKKKLSLEKRSKELKQIFKQKHVPVQVASSMTNYAGTIRQFDEVLLQKYIQWEEEFPLHIKVRTDGDSFYRCAIILYIIHIILADNQSPIATLINSIIKLPPLEYKTEGIDRRNKGIISDEELKAYFLIFVIHQYQQKQKENEYDIQDFFIAYNLDILIDFAAVILLKNMTLQVYQERKMMGTFKGWTEEFEKEQLQIFIQKLGVEAKEKEATLSSNAIRIRILVLKLYEEAKNELISQVNEWYVVQDNYTNEMNLIFTGDHYNIIFHQSFLQKNYKFFSKFIQSKLLIVEFEEKLSNSSKLVLSPPVESQESQIPRKKTVSIDCLSQNSSKFNSSYDSQISKFDPLVFQDLEIINQFERIQKKNQIRNNNEWKFQASQSESYQKKLKEQNEIQEKIKLRNKNQEQVDISEENMGDKLNAYLLQDTIRNDKISSQKLGDSSQRIINRRQGDREKFSETLLNLSQQKIDSLFKKIDNLGQTGSIFQNQKEKQSFDSKKQVKNNIKEQERTQSVEVQKELKKLQDATGKVLNTQESEKIQDLDEKNNEQQIILNQDEEKKQQDEEEEEKQVKNEEKKVQEEEIKKSQKSQESQEIKSQKLQENSQLVIQGDKSKENKSVTSINEGNEKQMYIQDMQQKLSKVIDFQLRCLDCDQMSSIEKKIIVKKLFEQIIFCNNCIKQKIDYLKKNKLQRISFCGVIIYKFQLAYELNQANDLLSVYGDSSEDNDESNDDESDEDQVDDEGDNGSEDQQQNNKNDDDDGEDNDNVNVKGTEKGKGKEKEKGKKRKNDSDCNYSKSSIELVAENDNFLFTSNEQGFSRKLDQLAEAKIMTDHKQQIQIKCQLCQTKIEDIQILTINSYDDTNSINICIDCIEQHYKEAKSKQYIITMKLGTIFVKPQQIIDQYEILNLKSPSKQKVKEKQSLEMKLSYQVCQYFCKYKQNKKDNQKSGINCVFEIESTGKKMCNYCFQRILLSPVSIDDLVDQNSQIKIFDYLFKQDFIRDICISCSEKIKIHNFLFRFSEITHSFDCFICISCARQYLLNNLEDSQVIQKIKQTKKVFQILYNKIQVFFQITCNQSVESSIKKQLQDEPIEEFICLNCQSIDTPPLFELNQNFELGKFICVKCFLTVHSFCTKEEMIEQLQLSQAQYKSFQYRSFDYLKENGQCTTCFHLDSIKQQKESIIFVWVKTYAKHLPLCLSCLNRSYCVFGLNQIYEVQGQIFKKKIFFTQGSDSHHKLSNIITKDNKDLTYSEMEQDLNSHIKSEINDTQISPKSCFCCKDESKDAFKMLYCSCLLCIKCISKQSLQNKKDFFICPSVHCIKKHLKGATITHIENQLQNILMKRKAEYEIKKAAKQLKYQQKYVCSICSSPSSPVIITNQKYCSCKRLCKQCLINMKEKKKCQKCQQEMWNVSIQDIESFSQKMICPICTSFLTLPNLGILPSKLFLNCQNCLYQLTFIT